MTAVCLINPLKKAFTDCVHYTIWPTLQVSERVHLFWCSATHTPQCLSASNSRSEIETKQNNEPGLKNT